MIASDTDWSSDDLDEIKKRSAIARLDFHESLPSTNTRALELVREHGTELPLVVLTTEQTAGRGRGSNLWQSSAGSLTFSLAAELSREIVSNRVARLSLAMGVAVARAIEGFLDEASRVALKWPNDVLVDDGKVCGILVELVTVPTPRVVVGIGVNVNNDVSRVELNNLPRALSLSNVTGNQLNRREVLIQVLIQLGQVLEADFLQQDGWLDDYRDRCVLTGRNISVESAAGQITGECRGVDEDGALVILSEHGVERVVTGSVVDIGADAH
ncbi:MAG: biotin--[acetyl-CoA-carboxylase] ligase [Pirellulales bacterium]|nr:biotin--[acetyl-CoA-carboxylase] ligase [Pirellulales bacterium]